MSSQSELPELGLQEGLGAMGAAHSAINSGRLMPCPVSEPALDQTCLYSLDKVTYCF